MLGEVLDLRVYVREFFICMKEVLSGMCVDTDRWSCTILSSASDPRDYNRTNKGGIRFEYSKK